MKRMLNKPTKSIQTSKQSTIDKINSQHFQSVSVSLLVS